ncbi:MAG: glycosyltransferase [Candidatus Pacebacteria bacterium]|nr:glycosyltransferase [Candidatus Paceibacterota bacterium]
MNNPLVTICITTYNRAQLLTAAVRSVQDQTYKNLEIIIINDHSTDQTPQVIKKLQKNDSRVRVFTHRTNQGLAKSRNQAIRAAHGKYFSFLDDDDLWDKDLIDNFVQLAEKHNSQWCFCAGNKITVFNQQYCVIPTFNGCLKKYLKLGYTPPVSAQFYFTQTLKQLGGYHDQIKSGVDHDLWIKLAINNTKIKSLPYCSAYSNPNNKTINRMTTQYQQRVQKIKKSLKVWQPLLTKHFGKKFYQHFLQSYFYIIERDFLVRQLQKHQWKKVWQHFQRNPQKKLLMKYLIKGLIKITKQRFIKNKKKLIRVNLQPNFPAF